MHSLEFHPVPVTLAVGEPIETTGYRMKQVEELTARISDEICHLYYRHSYLQQPRSPTWKQSRWLLQRRTSSEEAKDRHTGADIERP